MRNISQVRTGYRVISNRLKELEWPRSLRGQCDSTLFSYTGGLTCTVGFLYMVYPRPCVSCKNFARLMHYQKNLNSAEQCSTRSSLGQSQRLLFLSEVSVTASSSPYEGQLSILPDVIECNESQL
ncbi:unnamed protein product [Albugo candida]|uniref:Uncharacterized protein n=1 Tax=Albugo candida TaxID=65357 RepID=A0A024G8X7_9STRA|nr:unnamed protein product [Albugo candida]|eukprot:CCI43124.1 unnamed protein product [Albugo candida]